MSRFRKLRLESLESKNLLAVDVALSAIDGNLSLTGDMTNENVTMVGDATTGDYTLTSNNTTFNFGTMMGLTSVSLSGVTGDVTVDLGDGLNSFVLDNSSLPGSFHAISGPGSSGFTLGTLSLTGPRVSIAGDVTYQTTNSNVGFQVVGVDILGNVELNGSISIGEAIAFGNASIAGDLTASLDANQVPLALIDVDSIGGNVNLSGNDLFVGINSFGTSTGIPLVVGGDFDLVSTGTGDANGEIVDLTVTGDLNWDSSTGGSSALFERLTASSTSFVMGEDDQAVLLSDSDIAGDVSITFGDAISTATQAVQIEGSIGGSITTNLGGGDGSRTFDVVEADVTGDVLLTVGGGDTLVRFGDSSVDGDVTTTTLGSFDFGAADLTLLGDLNVSSDLESLLDIENLSASNGFQLATASGSGLLRLQADDDFRLTDGSGAGEYEIDGLVVADDVRINAGDGGFGLSLTGVSAGDDLVFSGGDGVDVVEMEAGDFDNVVGDDLYLSGRGGNDEFVVADTDIDDKLRISGNGGDDFVEINGITVGRSALVSLGRGVNEADIAGISGGIRGLTVLGRGENAVTIQDTTTSHYVDVLTSSGEDSVVLNNVITHSVWIATFAGVDDVTINNSIVDYLFVFLGSGDDMLTLEGVTVDRLAVLSGGSGNGDELIDVEDMAGNSTNDINFAIDFAFEIGGI